MQSKKGKVITWHRVGRKEENKFLKELCLKEGVTFVDYYSACVSSDGITMQDLTFGDDLHPHVVGYNKMAELLYPVFDKIFNKE